uniref:Uncharacterized protein n=1 Tax=Trichogramma kaykai TaxID=54128 RepID=A0ABD2WNF3_9HYME
MGINKMGHILKVTKLIDSIKEATVIIELQEDPKISRHDKDGNEKLNENDHFKNNEKNSEESDFEELDNVVEVNTMTPAEKNDTNVNENVVQTTNPPNPKEKKRPPVRRQPKACEQEKINTIHIDILEWLKDLTYSMDNEEKPMISILESKFGTTKLQNQKIVKRLRIMIEETWGSKYPHLMFVDKVAQKLVEQFSSLGDWIKWSMAIESNLKTSREELFGDDRKYNKKKSVVLPDVDILSPQEAHTMNTRNLKILCDTAENKTAIISLMNKTREYRISNDSKLKLNDKLKKYPHLLSYEGELKRPKVETMIGYDKIHKILQGKLNNSIITIIVLKGDNYIEINKKSKIPLLIAMNDTGSITQSFYNILINSRCMTIGENFITAFDIYLKTMLVFSISPPDILKDFFNFFYVLIEVKNLKDCGEKVKNFYEEI